MFDTGQTGFSGSSDTGQAVLGPLPTPCSAGRPTLYFMHQVRFGGMHCRKRAADNQQNNINEDEATDDEELQTDPNCKQQNCLTKSVRSDTATLYYPPPLDAKIGKYGSRICKRIRQYQRVATGA